MTDLWPRLAVILLVPGLVGLALFSALRANRRPNGGRPKDKGRDDNDPPSREPRG